MRASASPTLNGVPHRPEDDWTRPMPRTRRGDPGDPGDEWVTDSTRRRTQESWDPREDGRADDEALDQTQVLQPAGPRPPGPRQRPRYALRRAVVILLVLVLAYVGAMVWAVTGIWGSIDRVDAEPTNAARPEPGSGTNFVLVGTDSREDLTDEERQEYNTGAVEGARADTIMLLHLPSGGGDPTLLSIPRDSYVEIPGYGSNKINAAYSLEGPALLVDTVEQSTGLSVEGYVEIGFDGFVDVVTGVGGVQMCLDEPVVEERSDLDLPAGCQELAGNDALAYVRMRYADPRGDLGRVERQREFLSSLVGALTTPSTLFLPWELRSAGTSTGQALAIGEDTSMWEMGRFALAMRAVSNGEGNSITVPIGDPDYASDAGSAVLWDEEAAPELFEALRTDAPLTIEP